jgi:hypothetical protein
MEVVQRNFPKIISSDEVYPVLIWLERPEIVRVAIYDHTKRRDVSISQAHELPDQILYESIDFVHEKGLGFTVGKLYKGIAVYTKNMKNLKTLQTQNHKVHIFY